MSRSLIAKFKAEEVTNFAYKNQRVKMTAVTDTVHKGSENNTFSIATPWGTLEMMVSNPDAIDFLKPGKSYYLEFTEAED